MNQLATESNPLKGILICLLGYFFASLIGIFEKLMSPAVTITEILFFQNLVCLLLTIFSLVKMDFYALKITVPGTYLIRIVSGLGCYAFLFYTIRFIPISEALIYQYSAALWIPFIMSSWLNIKMPKKQWWGIFVGFIGILFVLKPSPAFFGLVSIFGILCGVLQAFSFVAIRKLAVTEPILRVLFYYFLVGTLVSALLLIKHGSPIDLKDFILLLAIGLSTFFSQKYLNIALKYASPATLAPVCYTVILFAGLFAWLFWHEIPHNDKLAGMAMIIVGCLVTILISNQSTKVQSI